MKVWVGGNYTKPMCTERDKLVKTFPALERRLLFRAINFYIFCNGKRKCFLLPDMGMVSKWSLLRVSGIQRKR